MKQEYFDIYDEAGNRIGRALRSECHGNPALLHHTSHVVVFHPAGGRILLQKAVDVLPDGWTITLQSGDAVNFLVEGKPYELTEKGATCHEAL